MGNIRRSRQAQEVMGSKGILATYHGMKRVTTSVQYRSAYLRAAGRTLWAVLTPLTRWNIRDRHPGLSSFEKSSAVTRTNHSRRHDDASLRVFEMSSSGMSPFYPLFVLSAPTLLIATAVRIEPGAPSSKPTPPIRRESNLTDRDPLTPLSLPLPRLFRCTSSRCFTSPSPTWQTRGRAIPCG